MSLAYTYTDARDRISPDCFNVTCNLDFTPLDGTLDEPGLARPRPSRVTAQDHARGDGGATTRIPGRAVLQRLLRATLHLLISGDANADGLSLIGLGNDIIYVPRNAADITLDDPGQWARPRQR